MTNFLIDQCGRFEIDMDKIEQLLLLESVSGTGKAIGTAIQKTIELLKKYTTNIKNFIVRQVKEKMLAVKIAHIKKELHNLEAMGVRTTEFVDINKLEKLHEEAFKFIEGSLNRFMSMYHQGLTGAAVTEVFIATFNRGLDSYNTRIAKCISEKKPMKIKDVLDWIEDNISGRGKLIGTLDKYQQSLERAKREGESIRNACREYEETNGYVVSTANLNDMVKNITIFTKKNYDWIALFCLSATAGVAANVAKQAGKPHYFDRIYEDYPQLMGEDMEDMQKWYNYYYQHPEFYKNGYRVAEDVLKTTSGALTAASFAEMYNAYKNERRNTITLK